jgi:hypothetical protein
MDLQVQLLNHLAVKAADFSPVLDLMTSDESVTV